MGSTPKPTSDLRPWLPCSMTVPHMGSLTQHQGRSIFFLGAGASYHGFCSSECLSLKCVLSVTGESATCPTNAFSINSGSHCCACTLPHLCTGICTPSAGGHSLLGNLPLGTACKLGQLEIRGRTRCSWIFPQIRKPFPPLGVHHAQCYSSELGLPLQSYSTCTCVGTRGNQVSASLW